MQCKAKAKSTQKRCTRDAIAGGNVCRVHGGAAPQVKASAQLRLAALVDPAIGELAKLLKSKGVPHSVRMTAIRDVLDRNGFKPKDESVLDFRGDTLEQLLTAYNRAGREQE